MAKDLEAVPSSTSAPDHTAERGPDVELAQVTTAAAAAAAALGGQETPVEAPAAGEIVVIPARPGDTFVVTFDPAAAKITLEDGDLVLSFADGGQIVFAGFAAAAEADQPPALILPDGTVLAGNVVVVVALAAAEALDLATAAAAGPEILGGGFNVYGEDLGDVIDLLTPLGVLPPTALQFPGFEPPEDTGLLVPAGEGGPPPVEEPEEEPPPEEDDEPSVGEPQSTLVDEDLLPGGIEGGPGDIDAGAGTVTTMDTANLDYDFGGDGPGDVSFASLNGDPVVDKDGAAVTSNGDSLVWSWDGASHTLTALNESAEPVLTLQVTNVATGDYKVTLLDVLDHPVADTEDDIVFELGFVVTDFDGDSAFGTVTVTVDDDVPIALPDSNSAVIDPNPVTVTGNVLLGNDGTPDTSDDDLFGADGPNSSTPIVQIKHDGITYTFNGTTVTATAGVLGTDFFFVDGDLSFDSALGGTFKIGLVDDTDGLDLGDYEYTPPTGGDPEAETFEYFIKDGDGDTDSATLTIFLGQAVITSAELQTSTSADLQVVRVTVTEHPGQFISGELELLEATAQEESDLQFGGTLVLDPDSNFTVIVEYVDGSNSIDVTGLILTDVNGVPIFTLNPFTNDIFDFRIGVQSNDYDGGIYILEGDGTSFNAVPPVGYDFDGTTLQLETTRPGNHDFDLNLSDLVVNTFADPDGNPATDDGVATIDISGNFTGGQPNNEDNTLTLTANDVLDMNSPSETLTILGGPDDVVNLVDQDGGSGDAWTVTDTPTGFDTWTFGTIATVIIDDDVTVNVIV